MQTTNPVDWHIYLHNIGTGSQTCDYSGTNGYGGIKTCANTATARCQLLHNTGPTRIAAPVVLSRAANHLLADAEVRAAITCDFRFASVK